MKNPTTHPAIILPNLVKFLAKAFKSVFTSESKTDFARLKNFIAS